MRVLACVLLYLAGRQVQSLPKQPRIGRSRDVGEVHPYRKSLGEEAVSERNAKQVAMVNPLTTLAWFLLAQHPEMAFRISGPRHTIPGKRVVNELSPRDVFPRWRRLRNNVQLLFDASDPCVPSEGQKFPADGTILRNAPVVKVTDLAVFVEVDADSKLQGIMYGAGCDVGYIKNLQKTFFVGDKIDVKSLGVSGTSGKLLLSRKAVIEEEGSTKHDLPEDGREQPKRHGIIKPREVEMPDPAVPPQGVDVPAEGTNLYNLKIVKVEPLGIFLEVDAQKKLVGYVPSSGVDASYVKNIEKTFFVGDRVAATCIGVSGTSGKLLLSRKRIMEEEGSVKHELPQDGREQPKRSAPIPPREIELPDPSIPPKGAVIPEANIDLRDLTVVRVEEQGIFVEVDAEQNLVGYMPSSGVDCNYVKNLEKTFKVGDIIDARNIGVSGITGRLLLSRKAIMDDEGWEAHELPDDGREMVKRFGPSGLTPKKKPARAPPTPAPAPAPAAPAPAAPAGGGSCSSSCSSAGCG